MMRCISNTNVLPMETVSEFLSIIQDLKLRIGRLPNMLPAGIGQLCKLLE